MAKTKLALWKHLRQHFIQEECSGFVCTLCPFATTLKHHMTFHWFSAHDDFKGFMCTECSYTCVSKSMLTSHMKTHSEVYQYNCGSCTYKTKFCNAMKKHLKDNLHIAGTVLNPDGTPNPFATIDVYGSKRGPRRKPFVEEKRESTETKDMPSTSGIIAPILSIPTSSASVLSIPISSTASTFLDSNSNVRLMSSVQMPSQRSPVQMPIQRSPVQMPIQRSPVRISPTQGSPIRMPTPISSIHSNSLVTANLATLNRMNNENGENPSINGQSLFPNNNNAFSILCQLLFKEIATREDVDNKEQNQVFRLLGNAQKYLASDPGHVIHVANTTAANGDLSDNARNIDEPSTSTTLISEAQPAAEEDEILNEPLDLSMSAMSKRENQPQFQESVASPSSRRNKRKRKAMKLAMKLEYPTTNEITDDNATQTWNTNQIYSESSLPTCLTASQSEEKNKTFDITYNANMCKTFICSHCHIIFANEIMHAVHMSFHNSTNPLICALCDEKSTNILSFFLHLIRTKH